jgi:hypothetical protein
MVLSLRNTKLPGSQSLARPVQWHWQLSQIDHLSVCGQKRLSSMVGGVAFGGRLSISRVSSWLRAFLAAQQSTQYQVASTSPFFHPSAICWYVSSLVTGR